MKQTNIFNLLKQTNIHKLLISIFLILILESTLAMANAKGNGSDTNLTNSGGLSTDQIQKVDTPYQVAIKKGIENGNLTPSIKPEYNIEILENTKNHLKVKGTTKIQFNSPKEAGYENNKWPKFVIKDPKKNMIGKGIIKPGDYDQFVKDFLKSKILAIQNETQRSFALATLNQSFGSEQRNHIITETYEITYPENISSTISSITANNDILMGFTRTTPTIHWTIEDRSEVCIPFLGCHEVYYYKAGFEEDGALGLRLPTEVTLNLPDKMFVGQNYTLSTAIIGRDWDETKYIQANVPPENGNEFVARLDFFIGVIVRIGGYTAIDWSINIDKDYSRSFKTPIGINEELPIPDLDLSPEETGLTYGLGVAYLGIGLKINPDIDPQKITTDWNANGDSVGSGSTMYNESGTRYEFGPVKAGNYSPNTEYAQIRLSNYKYYFDICKLDLNANVQFNVISINLAATDYVNIMTLSCNDITNGLYLGIHKNTNANSAEGNVLVVSDFIPPASITNLHNITYAPNYIKWSWNDPKDIDFDKVIVYINGKYQTSVPKGQQYYNGTELLVDEYYNISTRTIDKAGNINSTPVNNTTKTKNTRIIYDNFDDNVTNYSKWIVSTSGTGPMIKETNKGLEIKIPYNSAGDLTGFFGARYSSVCKLRGDFDIQTDYKLITWPNYNGIGIGLRPPVAAVERDSLTSLDVGGPAEVYLLGVNNIDYGVTNTTHISGKLRMTRWGNKVGGYFYSSQGNWVEINKTVATPIDTRFRLSAYGYDNTFANKDVNIAFDNFFINYGQLKCP